MRLDAYWSGGGMVLSVLVKLKASRSQVTQIKDRALEVRVAAAPVDGRANAELVATLAKFFGLSKSAVELIAGRASRHKRVKLCGLSPSDLERRLQDL